MESRFDYKAVEPEIYGEWEKSGGFAGPEADEAKKAGKKPFCIIMPPPNANDPLHVGHAMFVTIEDILIRYQRMMGAAALWLPGTDHAGIETQFVFEKKLQKKGKSRFDYDRETLYRMIWEYVQENGQVAMGQMKQLGASADWERYKFTLDKEIVSEVNKTFKKLHDDGLVYRAERLVNYCTKCGTSYSELEVEYEERKDPLYYIKYGPFVLATVRPETKFGDTGLAVNPKDERYKKWIGKEIEAVGLLGKMKLKVVADEAVDMEFGTGVVKVTPAHDPVDFEMGERHNLPLKQVIDFRGKLNELAGPYQGLSVAEAREKIVNDMMAKGMIEKVDNDYTHRVGVCYRCGRVIEPLPKKQWFIKVKPLTSKALEALDEKKIKIHGAGREKILRHWLNNLRDWNISRQIVWGIRMPVWYKKNSDEYVVSEVSPGDEYEQEKDTFDTWFSSSQWPVVTLKTGHEGDFSYYYPTAVMETAYDILMFWVMRMMMMGIYLTGEVPFKEVYLHGLIRDEKGLKMSKSKGNVMDPIDMVDKYGADALRMALVMSSTPGRDKNVAEEAIKGMRNFSNKIWNASRYILLTREKMQQEGELDDKYRKKLSVIGSKLHKQMDKLKVGLAAEMLHNEFWHWYCDEGIEKSKEGKVGVEVMIEGLISFLKWLHPFVPYVTEAVWQELKQEGLVKEELLMNSKMQVL